MHVVSRVGVAGVVLGLVLMGCGGQPGASGGLEAAAARLPESQPKLIVDGASSGGNPHFFFLPPMVPQPTFSGDFDATLSPVVTVCRMAGPRCAAVVWRASTSGRGAETVRVQGPTQYHVDWHTDRCADGPCTLPADQRYRIRVQVGRAELGFADVTLVAAAADAQGLDPAQSVAVVNGSTLPIKFRIETGAVRVLPAGGGTATLDAAGGAVALGDALGLVVPKGALSSSTSISVSPATAYPPTTGIASGVYQLGPAGTTFAPPATLSLAVDPASLPLGAKETDLVVGSSSGATWDEAPGSALDATTHTLSAPLSHFSTWTTLVAATSVAVTPASPTVTLGKPVQLTATPMYGTTPLTGRTVTWTSSDPTIATVDSAGLVSTLKTGAVAIIATSGGVSGGAAVTVVAPPVIASFGPDQAIAQGSNATLWATFTGGVGRVQPGNFSMGSGQPLNVGAVWTATRYTLTVTNAAGDQATASATVTVYPRHFGCGQGVPGDRFYWLNCDETIPLDGARTWPLLLTLHAWDTNISGDWCSFDVAVNGSFRMSTQKFYNGSGEHAVQTWVAAWDRIDISLWTPGFGGFGGSGGGAATLYAQPGGNIDLYVYCH